MIHFDANATATLRPAVADAIQAALSSELGNPSSIYQAGRAARTALTNARQEILRKLLGDECARKGRLFFTSGGTEACNSAIRGFLNPAFPGRIVTSSIEHAAVLGELNSLTGWEVFKIDPESDGIVDPHRFVSAIDGRTALVILMAANNESGAIQPVAEIARELRVRGYSGPIFSDFTQAVGKSGLELAELFQAGVSAVAISGHKVGALSGIGAVILSTEGSCFQFSPLLHGGEQEEGFRSGTENLIGALSLRAAMGELTEAEQNRLRSLRDKLWDRLQRSVAPVKKLTPEDSLCNTLLLQIEGCRGDDLVVALDLMGVNISQGSACSSGKQRVSHVVTAMGLSEKEAKEVVRISLDWSVDEKALTLGAERIEQAVARMREVAG
jgi:cysteine desulfurase